MSAAPIAKIGGDPTYQHVLSPSELESWKQDGFLGPYTAWTPEEMERMRPAIRAVYQRPSPVYGFNVIRDRHLDCKTLYDACVHPAIVERCAQLLGHDLLLWRSNYFPKRPGAPETMWHQGWDFPGVRNMPAINRPINVTAWMAIMDSDRENGCLQLIRGSHRLGKIEYAKVAPGEGIFGSELAMPDVDLSESVHMEVKAGQFFMFNEAMLHGADPNNSDRHRVGVGIRYTNNETKIYHKQSVCGQGLHLKKWHAIQVSGEDKFGHNKIGPPPDRDEYPMGRFARFAGRMRKQWQTRVYSFGRRSRQAVDDLEKRSDRQPAKQ